MTKKLVLLACIAALAVGASAQTATSISKIHWTDAPKSHAVTFQIQPPSLASSADMTLKVGPNAPRFKTGTSASSADMTLKVGPTANKSRTTSIVKSADLIQKYGPNALAKGARAGKK
jgi:hypothetical protein